MKYTLKLIFPKPIKRGNALSSEYDFLSTGNILPTATRFYKEYPKGKIELAIDERVFFSGNYWDFKNYIESKQEA